MHRILKTKMTHYLMLFILVATWTLSSPGSGGAEQLVSPIGLWLTEGGKSRVSIKKCGTTLCGRIVWLKEPLTKDNKPKTDINNPDKSLRSRPILGLPLLVGFSGIPIDNVWKDGQIYNPEDGKTYSANLTMMDGDRMKVRGYVGLPLFGKSTEWLRIK